MSEYLFLILFGIILFLLLNNYNTFSVGIPTWDEWRNWLSSFVCNGPVVDEVDEVDETLTEGDVFIFNYNDLNTWYQRLSNLSPTNPNRPNRQILDQLALNVDFIAGWLSNHDDMLRLSNDNQLYGYVRNIGIPNIINTVRAEMFTVHDVDAMEDYLRDRLTLSERRLVLAQINTEVNGELVDLPDDVMQIIVDYLPNPQLPTLTIPIERLYDNRDYTFIQNPRLGAIPVDFVQNHRIMPSIEPCNVYNIIRRFLYLMDIHFNRQQNDRQQNECATRRRGVRRELQP